MKKIFIMFTLLALVAFSCKKDEPADTQNNEQLNAAATAGSAISTGMKSFIMNSVLVAADSGYSFTFPNDSKKSALSAMDNYQWTGPDADGWYTRYMSGTYEYYEKLRIRDTIEYLLVISYSGGDGSFENKTETKYIKKEKNGKTVYDGYSIWTVHNSGYNDISKWEWDIKFSDWNPETSAGTYDWYWGVSENSGGDVVPYHRCEHLEATETGTKGWIHCHVIFYDDSGSETWDFEYDTPWVPVPMPVVPGWNG